MTNNNKTALGKSGITAEQFIELWNKFKKKKTLAAYLGWHPDTVKLTMHRLGIYGRSGKPKGATTYQKSNDFAKWLKEHPEIPLPNSYLAMAEMSGIRLSAVRVYFKQRRIKYIRQIEARGDLRKSQVIIAANTSGWYLPCFGIERWEYAVNMMTLLVTLKIKMKACDKPFVMQLDPHAFKSLWSDSRKVVYVTLQPHRKRFRNSHKFLSVGEQSSDTGSSSDSPSEGQNESALP